MTRLKFNCMHSTECNESSTMSIVLYKKFLSNFLKLYVFVTYLYLGWIMIDRCGTHFGTIMNFLRDGSVPLPETTKGVAELLAEAKYYCITELADSCERALVKKEPEPICRVPLITSQKEEQILIGASTKV